MEFPYSMEWGPIGICRTCLAENCPLLPIFGEGNLPEKIKALTSIDVTEDTSNLPTSICEFCTKNLNNFYKFRSEIQRNDLVLKSRQNFFAHQNCTLSDEFLFIGTVNTNESHNIDLKKSFLNENETFINSNNNEFDFNRNESFNLSVNESQGLLTNYNTESFINRNQFSASRNDLYISRNEISINNNQVPTNKNELSGIQNEFSETQNEFSKADNEFSQSQNKLSLNQNELPICRNEPSAIRDESFINRLESYINTDESLTNRIEPLPNINRSNLTSNVHHINSSIPLINTNEPNNVINADQSIIINTEQSYINGNEPIIDSDEKLIDNIIAILEVKENRDLSRLCLDNEREFQEGGQTTNLHLMKLGNKENIIINSEKQVSDQDSQRVYNKKTKFEDSTKINSLVEEINNIVEGKAQVLLKFDCDKQDDPHQMEINNLKPSTKSQLEMYDNEDVQQNGIKVETEGKNNKIDINPNDKLYNFFCDICPFKTTKQSALTYHKNLKHFKNTLKKLFVCSICSYTTHKRFLLTQHGRLKHGLIIKEKNENVFKCDICSYKTITRCGLTLHKKRKHGGINSTKRTAFTCNFCRFTTNDRKNFIAHKKKFSHYKTQLKSNKENVKIKNKYIKDQTYDDEKQDDEIIQIDVMQEKIFKGFICECGFKTKVHISFLLHRKNHEQTEEKIKSGQLYKCDNDKCSFKTSCLAGIKNHIKLHRETMENKKEEITYECVLCEFKTNSSRDLGIHQKTHPQIFEKTFKCDKCEFETKNCRSFRIHTKIKHKKTKVLTVESVRDNQADLNIIEKFFINGTKPKNGVKRPNLKLTKIANKPKTITIHIKETVKSQSKQTKTPRDKTTGWLKCNQCDFTTSLKNKLAYHKKTIHNMESTIMLNCTVCGKNVKSISFKTHMRTHTDSSITCEICGKIFKNYNSYISHPAMHIRQDSICEICGKKFEFKGEHERHMLTHRDANKRKKPCPICGKLMADVKRHLVTHTGERNHKCEFCNKVFSQKSVLQLHLKKHLDEKPYKCLLCGRSFTQKGSYQRHAMVKHKNNEQVVVVESKVGNK